jgi:hypothetical protein
MLRIVSVLSLAAACSGCFLFPDSDSPPPIEEPMETAGAAEEGWTFEIGQGETEYAPLEDGAHVTKVHGPQGGYHVHVAARLHVPNVDEELGPTPSTASHAYSAVSVEVEVVAAAAVVSRSVSMSSVRTVEETRVDLPGLYAYVDESVRGEITVNMKVASKDRSKWVSATRQVFVD